MTVHQGKIHNYLWMTLDYNEGGTVKVIMIDYINEIIASFDKEDPRSRGVNTSATTEYLYKVDEYCKNLSTDKSKMFHNLLVNILYITNQASPATYTAVAFLKTRVREPNKDYGYKLVHIIKYKRGKRYLPLILSANVSGVLKWCIDVSYSVHPNMREHTGGELFIGRGFTIVTLTNQMLNTRSSTESDIVGVHDFMLAVCWTRYFMGYQGYQVMENIVYQDNKRSIILDKNSK